MFFLLSAVCFEGWGPPVVEPLDRIREPGGPESIGASGDVFLLIFEIELMRPPGRPYLRSQIMR